MAVVVIDLMNPEEVEIKEPKREKPATETRPKANPNRRLQKQVININGEVVPAP